MQIWMTASQLRETILPIRRQEFQMFQMEECTVEKQKCRRIKHGCLIAVTYGTSTPVQSELMQTFHECITNVETLRYRANDCKIILCF